MKKLIVILILAIFTVNLYSQNFSISADLRARYEMRNGYATLRPDSALPANFISQRSRIIFNYENEKIKLRFSPQNVKVWGDVLSTSKNDINNSMHEAYGEVLINKTLSIKLGRQELNYDNARIFGNVDWTMQARSHDAIIFKIKLDSLHNLHLGAAYNSQTETNFKQNYTLPQYKTLQYLWYHGKFQTINISVLGLNNGMPYLDNRKEKIAFSQTSGLFANYQENNLSWEIAYYMQTGKIGKNNVNTMNANANIDYQISKRFKTGLGFEYISGKSNNDVSTDVKSFNPLYGTNHKFNGYMDFFYVGNHINTVGLIDMYANINYKHKNFAAKLTPHLFQSAESVYFAGEKQSKDLGTEIDFTMNYSLYKDCVIECGYSQIFATKTLEMLKTGNKNNSNNWAYVMIKINPQLFSSNLK